MDCANGFSKYTAATEGLTDTVARKRLEMLYDNGTYTELDRFAKNGDNGSGVITAFGYISGIGVYAYSQDVTEMGGAMGKVQAKKISKVYELACQNGAPVVGIFDSNGAFINEGLEAIDAYGMLIKAAGNISGVVPQISLIMGSCVGSAAILAAEADVTVMFKDAEYCVNSKAVTGDDTVGSADVAAKNGTANIVADSEEAAVKAVSDILTYLPENNLSVAPVADYAAAVAGECKISKVVDEGSFTEISAEYGKCAHVGFARIGGNSVGIVSTDPTKNDGKLCGKGAAKIARFVRLCDAFSLPVVTLLDCAGFMGSTDAELKGDVKSVAMLTHAYSEATTAKVTVIMGKAYGAAYTAMAGKASGVDTVLAWYDAEIAALEPMTAVQFLYKDRLGTETRESLENEYKLTVASPFTAAENGSVSDVIAPEDTAEKVITALEMLASKRVSTLDKKHSNIQL